MMSETVVTVQDGSTNNANNPRHGPTIKTEPGQPGLIGGIQINIPYFKSIPGIIKLVQLFLGIICMACASPAHLSGTHFFLFVATVTFIITLLWVFIYLLSIRELLKVPINWIVSELLYTSGSTVIYLLAFIVQLSVWSGYYTRDGTKGANITAGVFGIFNTLAYAAGTYFLWIERQNSSNQ